MFPYRLPLFLATLLSAARLFGAYTYAVVDPLTSLTSPDPNRWFVNGSPTAGSGGLTGDGSLIYKPTPPGGSANYEVRAKLMLPSGGGSYVLYLRASADARLSNSTSTGTFLAFEVVVEPNLVNGACVATLKGWRRVGGQLSPMTTNAMPCYSGMEVRAVAMPANQVALFLDGIYYGYWVDHQVVSGSPGIGGFGMGAGNSISRVDIGAMDGIAPSAVPAASIATAVFANRVEFQWPGVQDDANGTGLFGYHLFRNGNHLGLRQSPEMVDESAQPGTSYLYQVQAVDFHGNFSGLTDVPVTTPATGNVDPRRTGVRPLGTYWGGLGEQIDLQSGNVNFSMPLFKAQARGGWGVTFALSYNSQNWRRDTAGTARTWNHGRDVGYGYGWKFLAGSMAPVFNGYDTVGFYRFTDSTGAEYRFFETSFGSGEWLAKDGLFLTYKSAEKKLYFPDGSWWYFGAIAGGTEMDTGTMYPTLFQDRNGNQIKVRYRPGRGLPAINGSGRVWQVEDVRVSAGSAAFTCNYLSDSLQHLHTCSTAAGLNTGENYEVGIGAAGGLTDPFLGQSFGDKQLLGGITNTTPGVNAPYYFGYDNGATNGPGELTAAVFPYGGSLNWTYSVGTLAGGRQFRRAHYRSYNANDGQGAKTSTIDLYPGSNANLPVHEWSVVSDPSGHHDKAWWWNTNLGQATMGLPIAMADRDRQSSPWRTVAYRSFAWSLTGNGNPFIGTMAEALDPGQPYGKDRRTTQVINDDGNLTDRVEYPDGSSQVELRKYVYTYVGQGAGSSNPYRARHLRNLVSTVTVSRPLINGVQTAQSIRLVDNFYDQYGTPICDTQSVGSLAAMPNATQHDTGGYSAAMQVRGNLTRVATPQGQRCMSYNIGGVALTTWDGYGHSSSATADPQRNYAVPSAITTGSYSNTLTWDGTLNLTQNVGPNGATATFGWDSLRRETSRTLPNGAVINHEYGIGQGAGASWHKVTTGLSPNFRWTKTVFDGFGRTREVISGYKVGSTETAVSKVVTSYTPCACSPIGKVGWVTMPIAPTDDPSLAAKTVYLYDALGRTLSVTPPGNAGFTSYVYEGRTVKTVDPKGDWKRMEQDAIGNLVKVYEPRPGGGADYVTEYSYSVLGQLLKVKMARPSVLGSNPMVTQEREFTYNSKEQLVAEKQPEHGTNTPGTTTYAYNFDGSLQEKTDPKGQKVQWFYDGLGRPTEVKKLLVGGTEDACGRVKYQYDSQDKDGTFAGTNLAGRVASVETGCSTRGGLVQELYSYNVAGAVTTKRVRIVRGSSTVTKNIGYTFDAEGKLATVQYPDVARPFTYSYDLLGRPNRMTGLGWDSDQGAITSDHVTGVSYGLGGELLGMTYLQSSPVEQQQNRWFVETRSYNSRLQLTRQTAALNGGATVTDIRYNFAANNDGRIESRENLVSGETVSYQYDSLKRLTSATQTAGPVVQPANLQWGLSFTYDGFGNRWNQTIQGGKAGVPSALTFDEARNRITGQFWAYDANGNTTGMPQTSDLSYDVDNRLLTITREGSSEAYGYLADNKRFWKSAGGVESYYLYGVGGQRILTYSATFSGGVLTLGGSPKMDVVFAGRVIRTNGVAVVMDRLGSVVTRSTGAGTVANHRYYPYGEEIEPTVGNRNKFGTYHRDQTGLDYADQRYYVNSTGRFLTSDPIGYGLNWYGYSSGDPVGRNDPSGLADFSTTVWVAPPPGLTYWDTIGMGNGMCGGSSYADPACSGGGQQQVSGGPLPAAGTSTFVSPAATTGVTSGVSAYCAPVEACNIASSNVAQATAAINQPRLQGSDPAINPFAQQVLGRVGQTTGSLTTTTPYAAWLAAGTVAGGAFAGATASTSSSALFSLGDASVALFRAVEAPELLSISTTGSFLQSVNSLEAGKYFAATLQGAGQYAQMAGHAFATQYTIVSTSIPFRLLPASTTVDRGIVSYLIPPQTLPALAPPAIYNWTPYVWLP
jgi:RHS repeat-associated protein